MIEFSMDDVRKVTWIEPGKFELDIKPTTNFNNGVLLSIIWTNPNDHSIIYNYL